ncbi:ImuA family protein [Mucilaginibacter terrae]|uniref:ImuA family protein n=1 Tax=Mucilaginibacter terrae TaxID=1955052 RepID=UPI00362F43B4
METKKDIINRLKEEILLKQGYKPLQGDAAKIGGLQEIEAAFPNGVFPTGMMHEFVNPQVEHSTACGAFITGLIASLMPEGGICLWISANRIMFPPALKKFGIEPDSVIFIDLAREKDVLWATEEALKCDGLTAVISEIREITFTQSRRLQLAVEQSKVTGFVLRNDPNKVGNTACVARWQITPTPSQQIGRLPGVGFPRWKVELQKVRNGSPGIWTVEWRGKAFSLVADNLAVDTTVKQIRKAG